MIPSNTWVQIHKIILPSSQRLKTLPSETCTVPLELWVKGFLLQDAELFDVVKIRTITNRIETGTLLKANPSYMHNYGEFVPEILQIDRIIKNALFGGEAHE
ncbi:MAG: 2-amino-4-ketopentanoate thiolase [Firmicutes bacterium]|nr:2-amino-4-ketopentanoate thiolase [Bacillota bacterium]